MYYIISIFYMQNYTFYIFIYENYKKIEQTKHHTSIGIPFQSQTQNTPNPNMSIVLTPTVEAELYRSMAKATRNINDTFDFDREGMFGSELYMETPITMIQEAIYSVLTKHSVKHDAQNIEWLTMPFRSLLKNHDREITSLMLKNDFRTLSEQGVFRHIDSNEMKKKSLEWVKNFYTQNPDDLNFYDENDKPMKSNEVNLKGVMTTDLYWDQLPQIWANKGWGHTNPVLNVDQYKCDVINPAHQLETLFGESEIIFRIAESFDEMADRALIAHDIA